MLALNYWYRSCEVSLCKQECKEAKGPTEMESPRKQEDDPTPDLSLAQSLQGIINAGFVCGCMRGRV